MSDIVIDIALLSKRYSLSHQHRPDSLKGWLRGLVKRAATNATARSTDEEFWALRDVSLQIRQGDCLALIGKNGSGKSTLLKILSRIIPPTSGSIRVRGRVASLLEVGTGFHPELTGRENIFLNGAMLGCPEREIRRRFDAIVDFSGVERFLDTPVKHYSSGMYVRLAYAVAAHVDADILVIDEVLAVGDAEFRAKCLAHLHSVIAAGRTVIVVSHSPPLIEEIATRVALLDKGLLLRVGQAESDILGSYLEAKGSPA
jgi:lipopolysaccharide transport system ATP-binding protein